MSTEAGTSTENADHQCYIPKVMHFSSSDVEAKDKHQ